jgi:hypothetical protein
MKGTEDELPAPTIRNCAGTGDDGRLVTFDADLANPYLVDARGPDGARVRNFADDDLAGQLALLTNPATIKTGCEFTQPFEAMRRALDPATNPGFLRRDAQLMVVFLTNDDDCSFKTGALFDPANVTLGAQSFRCTSQGVYCSDGQVSDPGNHTCFPREDSDFIVPVSEYKEFLADLKPDRRDVVVSAVAGPADPFTVLSLGQPVLADSCTGPAGSARPAVRIDALVNAFGGAFVESCSQQDAYASLVTPVVNRQRSCLPNLRTSDGDDCRVIETINGRATELEPCDTGGDAACYTLFTDADACPRGDNIGIGIDRRGAVAPTRSTIEATCFVK